MKAYNSLLYIQVNVVNKFVEMPKLKKLTVTYFGVHNQTLLPLTPLLWASPRLEEFELRVGILFKSSL